MYNEITVMIGAEAHRAFLQNGFYNTTPPSRIHKHNYTEIHVISGEASIFTVGENKYSVEDGSILMIPPKTYHCHQVKEKGCRHSAFQIDLETEEPAICSIDPAIVSNFFKEIAKASESGDHTVISAYISLICSHFETVNKEIPKSGSDYGFLIREFLTQSYNQNIRLLDLAKALHLSERQAERLIIEHTGNTFRDELSSIRIEMAKHLIATTDMSLGEVADYVGYRSYAGFWKAMKKYGQ
jgi:YesN/AraC family two-component response regulator